MRFLKNIVRTYKVVPLHFFTQQTNISGSYMPGITKPSQIPGILSSNTVKCFFALLFVLGFKQIRNRCYQVSLLNPQRICPYLNVSLNNIFFASTFISVDRELQVIFFLLPFCSKPFFFSAVSHLRVVLASVTTTN